MANSTMTVFISVLIAISVYSEAYQMTKEELVEKLKEHKFPDEKIDDWVCLVEHESSRKTHVVGKVNKNGSRDYGLFQINDNYWCSNTTVPGKDCHVTCNDLIADDITKALNCAKKIYRRQGFLAWHGWENHCQNLHKNDIAQ